MALATRIDRVIEDKDPKAVIHEALDPFLKKFRTTAGDVLVCVYERSERTKGGLIIPETASRRAEDAIQGCVGLIVQIGPDFARHRKSLALDPVPKVDDWIMFRNQDCIAFQMGEGKDTRSMRLLQGDFIRAVIDDPQSVL